MLVLSPIDELPQSDVVHQTSATVYLRSPTGEDFVLGVGELCIGSSKFNFHTENGLGFSLAYPLISLHAISRDLSNFHSECLYLMFEKEDQLEDIDNSDSEATDEPINELRFVPSDLSQLDAMYRALCTCQLLHPDPQDSVSEEEEGEFEFGAMAGGEDQHQEDDGGSHNGHNGTQDMDVAEGQFEDAN